MAPHTIIDNIVVTIQCSSQKVVKLHNTYITKPIKPMKNHDIMEYPMNSHPIESKDSLRVKYKYVSNNIVAAPLNIIIIGIAQIINASQNSPIKQSTITKIGSVAKIKPANPESTPANHPGSVCLLYLLRPIIYTFQFIYKSTRIYLCIKILRQFYLTIFLHKSCATP